MKAPRTIYLLLALCTLCVLLGACAGESQPAASPQPEPSQRSVALWYLEDDPLADTLVLLTEAYNASGENVPVALRAFTSEESLAAAMDSARPDLLLCGHERAFALYDQGRLKSLPFYHGEKPAYTEAFRAASDSVGQSFFPIGAEVPLLAADAEAASAAGVELASLNSTEALCSAAAAYGRQEEKAFFSADSFAALFASCLAQLQTDFAAQRSVDIQNESFRRVYNLLADAAFYGGMTGGDGDALAAVIRGELLCAVSGSRSIQARGEGLSVRPLPVLSGGRPVCLAEARGLAVTAALDDGLQDAAAYISWLTAPERSIPLALDRGMLPALQGAWPQDGKALTAALSSVRDSYTLSFPSADSGYAKRGSSFDREFRAALALLK